MFTVNARWKFALCRPELFSVPQKIRGNIGYMVLVTGENTLSHFITLLKQLPALQIIKSVNRRYVHKCREHIHPFITKYIFYLDVLNLNIVPNYSTYSTLALGREELQVEPGVINCTINLGVCLGNFTAS